MLKAVLFPAFTSIMLINFPQQTQEIVPGEDKHPMTSSSVAYHSFSALQEQGLHPWRHKGLNPMIQ